MQRTVVVTGSGGRIGTILRQALADTYSLGGIDRVPTPGMPGALVAGLTDLDAILPAFKEADAVVHLAADPRHTPEIWWDTLIPDNVVATANVYAAARRAGVRRVVFFSSMHVCGMYESDPPWSRIATGDYAGLDPATVPLVTADMPTRPDGPYAVSKIFGEALGQYYAEAHGIEVVVVRLGTVGREDRPGRDPRSFVSWLSHRDLAHLTERALEAPGVEYEIVFGASDNTWKIYDTPRARTVLGYAPRDNAERFRDR
ncbi:MAG: NAD(P)-dependent oxidoreductase [Candidatus Rokuibacteriota bacterium]|nr:MAG: NAD(P)-dependent oxidoreductase [Candidatus Rokubacteria bacterium]